MLAHEHGGDPGGEAPEDLALGIDVPPQGPKNVCRGMVVTDLRVANR
jgi:hypothetical protein